MCAAGCGASVAKAQITLEKVISNGDPVPLVSGAIWTSGTGAYYCFGNGGTIDQTGHVAFHGKMAGGQGGVVTGGNDDIAFFGVPGSLQYLARIGDQAAGLPSGTNLLAFQTGIIPCSSSGAISVGGTCSPYYSAFISTGPFGGLTKVALTGDAMPGGSVLAVILGAASANSLNVNSNGQIAFTGTLNNAAGPPAVYVGGPGTLQLAFKTAVPYASLPSNNSFAKLGNVYLNGQGAIAASAFMTRDNVTFTDANDEVLFTRALGAADGVFNILAREGDPAPGCGGATFIRGLVNGGGNENTVFNQFAGNFNNLGHSIFSAGLEGTGVTTGNNTGLWYSNGTTTTLFRRAGNATTAVPGATLWFSGSLNGTTEASRVRLNNSDTVVWNATLTPGVGGVTSSTSGTLLRTTLGSSTDTILARQGSPVADPVTHAVVIPGAIWGSSFSGIQQNNRGQILFIASLADDPNDPNNDVSPSNNQALMAWDPVQGLMLVYRKGDDISPIVGFVPDSVSLGTANNGNAEGGSTVLSDNGWITFTVSTSIPTAPNSAILRARIPASCYPNCDGSTTAPILNVADFTCFLQKFAAGDPYANCDRSTTPPVLNVADFTCFLQRFAAACP
jgi:hypothetical protein